MMLAMFRPLFYYQWLCVFDDLGFLWHMSGTQLLTLGCCQTCEALGNEPLI